MDNWIKVTDSLPKIPKGDYAVTVLVTMFDSIYESIKPGYGSYVATSSFTDGTFRTLYFGDYDVEWKPCCHPVIAWQYMPEPCSHET